MQDDQKNLTNCEKPFAFSVKAVIVDDNGRCLLIRRSARSKFNAGQWDFPGGKVDEGESWDHALIREIEEETGLRTVLTRVAGAAQSELPDRMVAYLIMQARALSSKITLSSEHDDHVWVPRVDLTRFDLCPQFGAFAEAFACPE